MRRVLLLVVVVLGGCRSAEFAVDHQMTGLHVTAKFVAADRWAASGSSGGESRGLVR
jgi:hypothetical protein